MPIFLDHTEKIWVFIKVAEAGSFSRAAELLHISQPTVSHAVKELERLIGHRLLQRNTRGIMLTDSGKILFEEALKAKTLLVSVEVLLIHDNSMQVPKQLCLSTYESIAIYLWPKLTKILERSYPGTEITLITQRSEATINDILAGRVDIGLVVGPIVHPSLVVKPLYSDTFSFYGNSKKIDLQNEIIPIITVPDAQDSSGKTLKDWILSSKFSSHPIIALNSFEVCAEFANNEVGYALIPNRVYWHRKVSLRHLKLISNNGLNAHQFGQHEFFICYKSGLSSLNRFKEDISQKAARLITRWK